MTKGHGLPNLQWFAKLEQFFFLGFRHTLLPKRTRSMYENSEMIQHKELILTPISLQLLQVQISRALLRDS